MNAFTRSASSMASTMARVGRQRPHLDMRVLTTIYGVPFGPKRIVAVGEQYFSVLDMTYQQLLMGVTPDELELEPADPDAPEEMELMDDRRSILVNGELYRKFGLAQKPEQEGDRLRDVISALAVFAFIAGAGFWLTWLAA
ncbi:MAG: hypothetical protein E5Y67_12525 [Mesorhizobium sp.]|uniref:hypothetical protein n=1 Tax=Mesorhizobium sp. TaxID=1871066 RepID=UPI0012039A9E|nr:hypothetical protein [Mesorhizobium sp.]TIM14497.1 MAG: hypothetical protein E5Y67_12525 [Mesorhizobium sp.]